jgi:fermentation-respiration switch protein FrsA (DUF1100 family)
MEDYKQHDYALLDRPEVLMFLFHPRAEAVDAVAEGTAKDILITVEADIVVGARFHGTNLYAPTILFFHGNGEIVADYNDLGPIYNQMGINFFPVDYRGYGKSTGKPSVASMMNDSHVIFDFIKNFLADEDFQGPLVIMGRSLGSAPALELASSYKDEIDGLIIESGFALAEPLLRLLGIDPLAIGFREANGFCNIDKIQTFHKPTLIIHAENDHIIPFYNGQTLYDKSSAADKTLLKIYGANHNDIFMRGLDDYLTAVRNLVNAL